jgi:hypothetical protein
MSYWPWSLLWTILDDPVRKAFLGIYHYIQEFLQEISDRVFQGIEVDFPKEVEAKNSLKVDPVLAEFGVEQVVLRDRGHIVSLLERLLQSVPGDGDHVLDSWRAFDDGDMDECVSKYERAVREVRNAWGGPVFEGHGHLSGLYDFSEAKRLAYWKRGNRTAIIALEEQHNSRICSLTLATRTAKELVHQLGRHVPLSQGV